MKSNKKIIYVAHCVLNQNSVINGWERAKGGFNSILKQILAEEIAIIQLPCPEFTYLGENRPPMTKEEYDTAQYRKLCVELAAPIVTQMKVYQEKGYELIGLVGIGDSPTCDTLGKKGIFMEELYALMEEHAMRLTAIDIPPDYVEGETDFSVSIL